eukprot:CAMPEP_0202863206 /NCGR_PEP_ID=MMETSP1391-20130828/3937_1 /ASSEMBLY_ACC=CAM_ASM_000867 /TAXON_ID=1034604 /ORGANISM="Chlamydomonas leiostraca, Strain SAG 11-49" /LENGTH=154 /DNA_ID=CAMNT_0049542817 /DNA_START=170 /DNA_END=633 /DNA_ORIENTATION=+
MTDSPPNTDTRLISSFRKVSSQRYAYTTCSTLMAEPPGRGEQLEAPVEKVLAQHLAPKHHQQDHHLLLSGHHSWRWVTCHQRYAGDEDHTCMVPPCDGERRDGTSQHAHCHEGRRVAGGCCDSHDHAWHMTRHATRHVLHTVRLGHKEHAHNCE